MKVFPVHVGFSLRKKSRGHVFYTAMEQMMRIDGEEKGLYYFFKFAGVLSAQTVVDTRHFLEKALGSGATRLGIDLSEVAHIDSTGLGLLINLSKRLTKEGGECVLVAPSREVQLVIKATNTDKVFAIENSVELMENRFNSL